MNENQALDVFRRSMEEKFSEGYERYLEEKEIPERLVPKNVLASVLERQLDLGFDEFYQENKSDLDEGNVNEKVSDYLNENYDSTYIDMQFEASIDEEKLALDLKERVITTLTTTEPYGNVSRSYWAKQVHKVSSLKELSRYSEDGEVSEFVEKYAPDWEEVAEQDKD